MPTVSTGLRAAIDINPLSLGMPYDPGGGGVRFCWVCAADLSEPPPHYSLFCGQL